MPELSFLAQLLRQRFMNMKRQSPSLGSLLHNEETYRIVSIFIKGVRACLVIHNVKLSYIIGLPLTNLTVFITFIYSLREMILDPDTIHKFYEGGIFWFENLQDKDTTFILPFISLLLSYSALEVAFSKFSSPPPTVGNTASGVIPVPTTVGAGGNSSNSSSMPTGTNKYLFFFKDRFQFILFIKDLFQSIQIFSIPIVLSLPSGIFCYWIPSSLMSLAQIFLIRTEWFRKLMRMPSRHVPSHLKPPSSSSSPTAITTSNKSSTASSSSIDSNTMKNKIEDKPTSNQN